MIELIFSDSAAASLALAKRTGDISSICGTVISVDNEGDESVESYTLEPYEGPRVDGDVSDIAAIWLLGDIGDISDLSDWSSRLKLLRDISNAHEMESDEWIQKEAERMQEFIQRLKNASQSGESFRIWWSDAPGETCGFYWAMNILKNTTGAIYSIKVPHIRVNSNTYTIIRSTGDLLSEDFHGLLSLEKRVEPEECKAFSNIWKSLVAENAQLRAVVNGMPCSVPENFYDWALQRTFPDGEFKVVQAIGQALCDGPCGVTDFWYAWRIRHLIDIGELEIVKENKRFYYSTIRKKMLVSD